MSLIDPNTGAPINRSLTDPQILRAFAQLDQRINYLGQNLVQLGLNLEYLLQKIMEANGRQMNDGGDAIIPIDLDGEFQEFAAAKSKEIESEVEAIRNQLMAKRGMNLDDKSSQ